MEKLIKALQIFLKYGNPKYPTYCNREILYVNIDPAIVSEEDTDELARLGFKPNEDFESSFSSTIFGSY